MADDDLSLPDIFAWYRSIFLDLCLLAIADGNLRIIYFSVWFRHKRYKDERKNEDVKKQANDSILKFMPATCTYKVGDRRQKRISDAIVSRLIVGCWLPMSIVDSQQFREFLKDLDPMYRMISR